MRSRWALGALATLTCVGHTAPASAWTTVTSTAYAACEEQSIGSRGNRLREGLDVAMRLPYNTLVEVTPAPMHHRYWRVRDWPGGTDLDFYVPCGLMAPWGRRPVRYRVVQAKRS